MEITVRNEAPPDHAVVAAVNERAFGQPHEARLVGRLRGCADGLVSLVAEAEGRVVGHALFSPVAVETAAGDRVGERTCMALGPVAVDPPHQRRGVGTALIERGLGMLKADGCESVFVLGHPKYYPRFGFVPAADHGIHCEFPVPDEFFFAMELVPGALDGVRGTVRYHPEFAALEESP